MIKYILSLALCLWATSAMAFPPWFIGASRGVVAGGGGGCTSNFQSELGAFSEYRSFGVSTANSSAATKFSATKTTSICSVDLYLIANTANSGTVKVGIYSDNAGLPEVLIGTESTPVDITTLGSTTSSKTLFSGMNAAITASQDYWIVVSTSVLDATYFPRVNLTGTATTMAVRYYNGTSWAFYSGSKSMRYYIYE